MTNKVLVYGTLRRGHGNHRVMEYARGNFLKEVVVKGFQMWSLHGGFPGVKYTGNEEDFVVCELYEVMDMNPLDQLEGYSASRPEYGLYNRMTTPVEEEDAWIYTYNSAPSGNVITNWNEYRGY